MVLLMRLRKPTVEELEFLRGIADYQFGYPAGDLLITDEVVVGVSPATHRIREVYGEEGLLAVLRAHDYFYSLSLAGAKRLLKLPPPRLRAFIKTPADRLPSKSIPCSLVSYVDPYLYAGEEVIVVDSDGRLVGVGRLRLAPVEIHEQFCRGEAIRLRKIVESNAPD